MKKIYLKPAIKVAHIHTPRILAGSDVTLFGGGNGIEGATGQAKRLTSRDLFNLDYNGITLIDSEDELDEE